MKNLEVWAWWLVVAGALNWGLVGLGNWVGAGSWNVVELIVGNNLATFVYVVVGAAGLWLLWAKLGK